MKKARNKSSYNENQDFTRMQWVTGGDPSSRSRFGMDVKSYERTAPLE